MQQAKLGDTVLIRRPIPFTRSDHLLGLWGQCEDIKQYTLATQEEVEEFNASGCVVLSPTMIASNSH